MPRKKAKTGARKPKGKAPSPAFIELVDRMQKVLSRRRDISERRMFGGMCFMVRGNMACGVTGDGTLMLRVGPDDFDDVLRLKHARPMDFTGRPMKGFVYVEPAGIRTEKGLREWVDRGVSFARSLPPK